MVLLFPDLETLRLALTSGVVPPEISLKPAHMALDEDGRLWLEPAGAVPRGVQTALSKLAVKTVKGNHPELGETVSCWLQALPVRRSSDTLPGQAPILFDLPDPGELPALVGEMLRLGNDRQSFRFIENGSTQRVLLRVVGPPYYSLLRALEHSGTGTSRAAIRAYVEMAPRVWVEIGHDHPLAAQIKPAAGQLLLLEPPRHWAYITDAPFQDIYEILEFALPAGPVAWRDSELGRRLSVPLRLVRSGGTEPAELWVLRQRAIEQLDALVREADDRLLARLSFAVAKSASGNHTVIVLRVRRPSKQAAPVLALEAEPFRPYQKFENLYVPCGSRLGPPLRRDAVRKLLAEDTTRVSWLAAMGDGRFVPESVPEEAFRPLEQWVDYIIDRERSDLEAWVSATQFDFEAFICSEEEPGPDRKKDKGKGKKAKEEMAEAFEATSADVPPSAPAQKRGTSATEERFELAHVAPGELERRLAEAERRFLEQDLPLDAPQRREAWHELAEIHAALNHPVDASLCWVNCLWEQAPAPASLVRAWFETEHKTWRAKAGGEDVRAEVLEQIVQVPEPTTADLRALTALLTWTASGERDGEARRRVSASLDRIQRFLEIHESLLPIRHVWLAWVSVVRLAQGDVLALARARDRLLERLYHNGLSVEVDLPSFLRFSGQRGGDRYRAVREKLLDLHELARKWSAAEPIASFYGDAQTGAYIDLMFGFALARIGEAAASESLQLQAMEVLEKRDPAHDFLLKAFTFRIEQAREGKPHAVPLPAELLQESERLRGLEKKDKDKPSGQPVSLSYIIERLRKHSNILEPHDKFDPYRHNKKYQKEVVQSQLVDLPDITDAAELAQRVKYLLHELAPKRPDRDDQVRILTAVLQVSHRLGEEMTVDLLGRSLPVLEALAETPEQRPTLRSSEKRGIPLDLLELVVVMLERGLFLSAHFGQTGYVQRFVALFVQMFEVQWRLEAAEPLIGVVEKCFAGMRKLGLRDEIDRLLQQLAELIFQGEELPALRARWTLRWPAVLRTLLFLSACWLYFGRQERARAVLAEARSLLFDGELIYSERARLARAYLAALAHLPAREALAGVEEFLQHVRINDPFTTNSHYSLSQLEVVESIVLALVSDDFTMGSEVRRWLEDDEFLVRRRIHRDVREALGSHKHET